MLTEEKKEYFKDLLIQKLDGLIAEINKTMSSFSGPKDEPPDFLDQASMEYDTNFSLHLKERESRLMRKIRRALERLDEGNFGVCEKCGREISEERPVLWPPCALSAKKNRKH